MRRIFRAGVVLYFEKTVLITDFRRDARKFGRFGALRIFIADGENVFPFRQRKTQSRGRKDIF